MLPNGSFVRPRPQESPSGRRGRNRPPRRPQDARLVVVRIRLYALAIESMVKDFPHGILIYGIMCGVGAKVQKS